MRDGRLLLSDLRFGAARWPDRSPSTPGPGGDDRGPWRAVDLRARRPSRRRGSGVRRASPVLGRQRGSVRPAGLTATSASAVTLAGCRWTALESAGGLPSCDAPPGRARARDTRRLPAGDAGFSSPGRPPSETCRGSTSPTIPVFRRMGDDPFHRGERQPGHNYLICLRRTDGSPVVRLAEGTPGDLSPDGKSATDRADITAAARGLSHWRRGGAPARSGRDRELRKSARLLSRRPVVLAGGHEPDHVLACAGLRRSPAASRGPSLPGRHDARDAFFARCAPDSRSRRAAASSFTPRAAARGRPVPGRLPTKSRSAGAGTEARFSCATGTMFPANRAGRSSRRQAGSRANDRTGGAARCDVRGAAVHRRRREELRGRLLEDDLPPVPRGGSPTSGRFARAAASGRKAAATLAARVEDSPPKRGTPRGREGGAQNDEPARSRSTRLPSSNATRGERDVLKACVDLLLVAELRGPSTEHTARVPEHAQECIDRPVLPKRPERSRNEPRLAARLANSHSG